MSVSFGNIIGTENTTLIINSPIGGSIGSLEGLFRVTSTPQTVITARIPTNPLGTDQIPGSATLGISPNLIIPDGAYVYQVVWKLPSLVFNPAANSRIYNHLVGTSTDLLKVATAGQGVSVTTANSLGGLSAAIQSSGNFAAAAFETALGKWINPFANEASAITGLGAYSSLTDAQRTVNLYSVNSTGMAAGSGISSANIPIGYGYPQYVDIPIQVMYWLPPSIDTLAFTYGQVV